MEERKLPSGYVKETDLAKIKFPPVVFGCMRTAGWVMRELTLCCWKTSSVNVQCDAEKTITWSCRLRTQKVMGGHLIPQSCRVHRALHVLPEGLCVGYVTWWCVETTDTVGVGYVGVTCNRVHERHAVKEMTVARQFPISFIQTFAIGFNKPFRGCSSWETSGWSLAEVICKWGYSAAGLHRFCRTSWGTSKF